MKLCTLILVFLIVPSAFGGEYVWTFSQAKVNNEWWYTSGKAIVEFNNRTTVIKLYDGENPKFLRYTYKGKETENGMTGHLTIHNSGFGGGSFNGIVTNINSNTVFMLSDGLSFLNIKKTEK